MVVKSFKLSDYSYHSFTLVAIMIFSVASMLTLSISICDAQSTMSYSELCDDNRTICVGGKNQGKVVMKKIYTSITERVIYKAKRSVEGYLSGRQGKFYILLNIQNNQEFEQYVFARPSESYLNAKSGNRSYIELYKIYGRAVDNATSLAYEELLFGQSEDVEFILEGFSFLSGSVVVLETYFEDATTFELIQRVELEIASGPVCSDTVCEALEREGGSYCFGDCCGDGYCAQEEQSDSYYCAADCCGDGYCASEEENNSYCAADCCGDGYCAPSEQGICAKDCRQEISCSSCLEYDIQISGNYDYSCTGECPGYIIDKDENDNLYKRKLYDLYQMDSINTVSMPAYIKDPEPRRRDYTYIPQGGYLSSHYWISLPDEVKLFRFVMPKEISLKETTSEEWFSYQLGHWSFYMGTVVTVGTGTQDFVVKYAGSQCEETPPTYADYLSIRDKVWASKNLCPSIMGSCFGRLNNENIWYELGYHIPNPTPPVGCSGQPGSGCELGDRGQSVLVRELDDAQPGCYYALVVNWGQSKWGQTEDPAVRIQVNGTWLKKN